MKSSLQSYLRENARHGTPEFPVGFYTCLIPQDYQDLAFHWHEEMEFTLVRSGRLTFSIDLNTVEARSGDLLLIGSDTLHSAHQVHGEPAATESVVFHLDLAGLSVGDACTQRYVQPLREGKLPFPPVVHPDNPDYQELLKCFLALWDCRDSNLPYRELLFKAEALRLVHLLWQCSGDMARPLALRPPHPYEQKLKLVIAYMQEHYAEPITVKQLADLCGFSQVHFMNVFKVTIGSPCMEYLIQYRMAMAALDLQETNHSIMQVAMDNGFQNISYFNRTFKKHYHTTPSEYRRSRLTYEAESG